MMERELKSCPCARLNYNQKIKKTRPSRRILLNPGAKSVTALIKNKCIIRLAKQRSLIKGRKLNSLIKPCSGGKKSDSNNPNGSPINKRVANYPFIPVKLHTLSKKSREWIKLASHKQETKPSIPAKPNILINKNVLANQITYLTRLVSYDAKVQFFILDKHSVLINNSTLGNQVTYSKVNYPFIPVKYIATNKKSNIMEEKSIFRVDRSTPVGAYLFQKEDPRSSTPHTLDPGENHIMVKYEKVSEKSEMKELIKSSDRLLYCFTIRSHHRENSLYESFKRKPLMTTLKHSYNSLSGIYKQECIERIIPLKHPLCLKIAKDDFSKSKEVQRQD
jgi:hypothetical protein